MSFSDPVTEKQLDYIYRLIKQGWISIEDFPSKRSYYRKKTLTRFDADHIIRVGRERKEKRYDNLYP